MTADEKIIITLEKQFKRQARYQKYGTGVLLLAFVLLILAGATFKYHSITAIERIEQDREIIERQDAAIKRLEYSLDKQNQQLAEKDSIIARQQELIAGQAGYIERLKQENDYLKEQNINLEKRLQHEMHIDTIDSPLNRRKP